jgi:hypothetical protein
VKNQETPARITETSWVSLGMAAGFFTVCFFAGGKLANHEVRHQNSEEFKQQQMLVNQRQQDVNEKLVSGQAETNATLREILAIESERRRDERKKSRSEKND